MAEIRLNTLAWAKMLSQKNAAASKNAAKETVRAKPAKKSLGRRRMSVILLVKLVGSDCLYRANTQEKDAGGNLVVRFKTWIDRDGVDLYWMGRRVDVLYTMSLSAERWIDVSIPTAAEKLVKAGACVKVSSEPSPEGRLPA